MSQRSTFQVSLIVYNESSIINRLIEEYRKLLETPDPAFDTNENIQLRVSLAKTQDDVIQAATVTTNSHSEQRIIVLSDQLCDESDSGYTQTDFCRDIRTHFLHTPQHLCGLVALVTGESRRTSDIDKVVSLQDLRPSQFKKSIIQVAKGLWLKSPRPSRSETEATSFVRYDIVRNIEELKECLKLRYSVYDTLGYLPESVSRSQSRLDIDMFDTQALHFVAVENESQQIIGTLRLVMVAPNGMLNSVIGHPADVLRNQGNWVEQIAREALLAGDEIFTHRLQGGTPIPFPILQNTNFGEKLNAFLTAYNPGTGGEISRLVVSPRYRGRGVSEQLMRASIATAVDIQKMFLLLECVPIHVAMYEKYGFERIEGHHCRAQEIDQMAVGMKMDLGGHPYNPYVARAVLDKNILNHETNVRSCSHS